MVMRALFNKKLYFKLEPAASDWGFLVDIPEDLERRFLMAEAEFSSVNRELLDVVKKNKIEGAA